MNLPMFARRAIEAFIVATAFAFAHVAAVYFYFASDGIVSRTAFTSISLWAAVPAYALFAASLIVAAFPSFRYTRALTVLALSGLSVALVGIPLAFLDTPRGARADLFEPNTVFLLMPVPQVGAIIIALIVLLLVHLRSRRMSAVA